MLRALRWFSVLFLKYIILSSRNRRLDRVRPLRTSRSLDGEWVWVFRMLGLFVGLLVVLRNDEAFTICRMMFTYFYLRMRRGMILDFSLFVCTLIWSLVFSVIYKWDFLGFLFFLYFLLGISLYVWLLLFCLVCFESMWLVVLAVGGPQFPFVALMECFPRFL